MLYGLRGEVIHARPHTEADTASMLLEFLATFGNAVGADRCSLCFSIA